MKTNDWHELMTEWNTELLSDSEIIGRLSTQVIGAGWLGHERASDEQIGVAESRLGVKLPTSYRAFLQTSNGWGWAGPFIARIRPVEQVDWFRVENLDWVDMYAEVLGSVDRVPDHTYFVYGGAQDATNIRPEYLHSALQISDVTESTVLLLNPKITTADGEWEAWFFAAWIAGARRYPSFWEMMKDDLMTYKAVKFERHSR